MKARTCSAKGEVAWAVNAKHLQKPSKLYMNHGEYQEAHLRRSVWHMGFDQRQLNMYYQDEANSDIHEFMNTEYASQPTKLRNQRRNRRMVDTQGDSESDEAECEKEGSESAGPQQPAPSADQPQSPKKEGAKRQRGE